MALILRRAVMFGSVLAAQLAFEANAWCGAIGDVLNAWDERSLSVSSLHVRWEGEVVHHAEPSHAHHVNFEYAMDGGFANGRMRFAKTDLNVNPKSRRASLQPSVFVYDGANGVEFFEPADLEYPTAFTGIGDAGRVPHIRTLVLRMLYMPFTTGVGCFRRDSLSDTGNLITADGVECRVFATDFETVWVTNDADFLPVRYTSVELETRSPEFDFRIVYDRDTTSLPFPISWESMYMRSDGVVIEKLSARVTHVRLNEPLEDSLFAFPELPHGTVVRDVLSKTTHIVRVGQPDVQLSKGDWSSENYEKLLAGEKNSEGMPSPGQQGGLFLVANVVVVTLVFVYIVYARRRNLKNRA